MPNRIDIDQIVAIDVHVHLEHEGKQTDTDQAAAKYFGKTAAPHGAQALADYYRSRKLACIIFTVDERLTGRPHLTNDAILDFELSQAEMAEIATLSGRDGRIVDYAYSGSPKWD